MHDEFEHDARHTLQKTVAGVDHVRADARIAADEAAKALMIEARAVDWVTTLAFVAGSVAIVAAGCFCAGIVR